MLDLHKVHNGDHSDQQWNAIFDVIEQWNGQFIVHSAIIGDLFDHRGTL